MRKIPSVLAFASALLPAASSFADEINLYSVNTGSFVYHMSGNHGQYNEKFNNDFFSIERKFSEDSKYSLLVGTMKNSFADRCLSLGVRRDWLQGSGQNKGWTFKGVYAYTGEFFFDAFSHCGDSGTYHTAKKSPAWASHRISTTGCSTTLPTTSVLKAALFCRRYL